MTLFTTLGHVPLVAAGLFLLAGLALAMCDALNMVAWLEVFGEPS